MFNFFGNKVDKILDQLRDRIIYPTIAKEKLIELGHSDPKVIERYLYEIQDSYNRNCLLFVEVLAELQEVKAIPHLIKLLKRDKFVEHHTVFNAIITLSTMKRLNYSENSTVINNLQLDQIEYYDSYKNDPWIYDVDCNTWTSMNPITAPPVRYRHAMVYDSENKVVVLFGGYAYGFMLNDTWIYNVTNNTWVNMKPSNAPSPRYNHAMAYDPINKVVVLYGGSSNGGETWTYSVNNNKWTNKNPPPPTPGTKSSHDMVYDPVKKEVVLIHSTSMWAYSVSGNVWTSRNPSNAPDLDYDDEAVYDNLYEGGRVKQAQAGMDGRATVAVTGAGDYSHEKVLEAIRRQFSLIDPEAKSISRGERVLIKPNFIVPKPRANAVQPRR